MRKRALQWPVQTSLRVSDDVRTELHISHHGPHSAKCFAAKAQSACSRLVLNMKPAGL